MSPEIFEITDLGQLTQWVQAHLEVFSKGHLILLQGPMGAGKTTLVGEVIKALGGSEGQVSSPTFALHHLYPVAGFQVDHMDLYRLSSEEDLASSGFFEVVEDQEHLSFIEWAERIDEEFFKGLQRARVFKITLSLDTASRRFLQCARL
jgi:tRNA threonylcarbamoyladenosine biosynthesis protein TsaE